MGSKLKHFHVETHPMIKNKQANMKIEIKY